MLKNKTILSLLLFLLLQLAYCPGAVAHKVNIFAYVEGDTVYSESYFANGGSCINTKVEVYDMKGNKLLEGKTDENGKFSFKAPVKESMKLVVNDGLGHRNEFVLSEEELAGKNISADSPEQEANPQESSETVTGNNVDIKKIIDSSLDEKLQPVLSRLARLEEKKTSLTEILGGLGYIIGLMGIYLYYKSKQSEKKGG